VTDTRAWQVIRSIADRQTPKVRDAYLEAMQRIANAVSLTAIAEAIERGDASKVTNLLLLVNASKEMAEAIRLLKNVTLDAMAAATKQPMRANALAVRAAENQAAQLVTQVSSQSREAIRQTIIAGQRDGLSPQRMAKQIRSVIGLTERQAKAVDRLRQQLGAQGKSPDEIDAAAQRYAARLLRQRAQTIARTETIRASNAGQQAMWEQMQRTGFIPLGAQKRWIVTPDDRLCPICQDVGGQEVDVNEPFQTGYGPVMAPPAHPNCRCAMGLVAASLRVPAGQRVRVAA